METFIHTGALFARMKKVALALAVFVLLGASSSPVSLRVQTERASFDLLDTLAIRIAVDNPKSTPVQVRFLAPSEYAIEVAHDGATVWSNAVTASPIPALPGHTRVLTAGATTLALYDWNELLASGESPQAGRYTIRVRLLSENAPPVATTDVRFIAPLPIDALGKLRAGDAVTIGGRLDTSLQTLTDDTGSVKLSHRLLKAPDAPVVVRGFVVVLPDGSRTLAVSRWAPLAKRE